MRVRVDAVSKVYPAPASGRLVALKDVSLDVGDGEFVTILGPSGCGKSTLLQVVVGLEAPSSGRVTFEGAPPGVPLTAVVFQEHALFPWRTVRDNVTFGLEVRGVPAAERAVAAQRLLMLVELEGFADRHPTTSRAACASAWPSPGRLPSSRLCSCLMDEPFSALDAQSRTLMQLELLTLWERTRRPILSITHQIQEAVLLGDRVVVMTRRPGRILAVRPVPLSRPRDERTMLDPAFVTLSTPRPASAS